MNIEVINYRRLKILQRVKGSLDEKNVKFSKDFQGVFDEYFDKIYRFFFFRLRNVEDSEDLTAATFEKVFKYFDRFEDQGYGIKPWLFKIANNVLNDFLNKHRRVIVDSIDELTDNKQPAVDFDVKKIDEDLLKERLWEVIEGLPEREQRAWNLRLVDGLSYDEIGEVMGVSENNVAVIFNRSMKKLKTQLSYYG